ncbi:trimeric intracellular cation channel family protein [Undibacter mobilis]|uniref:Trimeric intracellular cation channel family protein n=1 Tax=Undibacter mobilis TaxID=2292256 RepID=A0A371B1E5_9BRAD|nr:trimeric intracellular cation channel family protein [Undibacter mobilis]RDV01405.1 trimeric intracellular cation channel family protein [Undibacter mobilis]
MPTSWLTALDWFGIAIFAVTGALVASRKRMDIFGFMLLGAATGIGGGSLRDVMLGQLPVFWVKEPASLVICLVVSAATFFLAHIPESRYRALLWLDAAGLALFCVVGADKALEAGTGGFIAVAMGVMSATFGGVIRDILGGESPLVLRKEIYVTAALAGAGAYVGLIGLGVSNAAATGTGFALCFTIRALALHYHWSLPVYRAREGRTVEEVEQLGQRPAKSQSGEGVDHG